MQDLDFLSVLEDGLGRPKVQKISFREFIPQAWQVIEPATKFEYNWHIGAIAEHLEAVEKRQIKRLLINIAPRVGKSLITSVFWPAWVWTQNPGEKFLCSSYSSELSVEHNIYTRRVIQSEWYQQNWGKAFHLVGDQNRKTYFQNNESGYRMATSVGGSGTGFGGSVIIVDDPHNVKEAPSKLKREEVLRWWTQVMSTRLNNPQTGVIVIIMQRVHMNDLAGFLIERGGFEHLCIPTEFEEKNRGSTSIGWTDPREYDRELLWPKIYGKNEVAAMKTDLGSYGFASQHQQRPTPLTGGLIKRGWWMFYDSENDLPKDALGRPSFDNIIASWDCNFKDADSADYVVGQIWGSKGPNRYLLTQVRDRMSFPQTLKAIKDLSNRYPVSATLIEDKANGPAVIQILRREIPGVIAVDPQGSKPARIQAVSPQIEAHNVYIPRNAGWVDDYIEEFAAATPEGGGMYWDQIDATSQALLRLTNNNRKLTWGREERSSRFNKPDGPKITFGRKIIHIGGRR